MACPIVYGVPLSTRTDSVRLALEEKHTEYEFAKLAPGASKQPPHLARQPFGKIPAFAHDGFALYETQACSRYAYSRRR